MIITSEIMGYIFEGDKKAQEDRDRIQAF